MSTTVATKQVRQSPRNPIDILLEPTISLGPNEGGKRISAYEALMRQEFRKAMEGNVPALKMFVKILRAQNKARVAMLKPGPKLTVDWGREPLCDHDGVLRLLGIAVRVTPPPLKVRDSEGRSVQRHQEPTLSLSTWAFEAAIERCHITNRAEIQKLQRWAQPIGTVDPRPVHVAIEPPVRDPTETRFKKGQSGNPRGRPRKERLPDRLPIESFLDEEVELRINGEMRTVSRLEGLLFAAQAQGLRGYAGVRRTLLELCTQELTARWVRREHQTHVLSYGDESQLDTPELQTFEQLQIINRRRGGFIMLERWIVELAVQRLERVLKEHEQIAVLRATPCPRRVNWPDWWLPHLREKAPRRRSRIRKDQSGWR